VEKEQCKQRSGVQTKDAPETAKSTSSSYQSSKRRVVIHRHHQGIRRTVKEKKKRKKEEKRSEQTRLITPGIAAPPAPAHAFKKSTRGFPSKKKTNRKKVTKKTNQPTNRKIPVFNKTPSPEFVQNNPPVLQSLFPLTYIPCPPHPASLFWH
jgi:hypothetical protein